MLAFLATGWGRAAAGLILASVMLAGIVTYGALQRRAGRQDAVIESTIQALRAAEVRHDIEDDLRRHPAGAAERLRDQWSRD